MRSSKEIQKDILLLMNELFQAQEEEKKKIQNELNYIHASINLLNELPARIDSLDLKNKKIAQILLED